jgi:serine/threonine protein phosphatase PrpC
MPVRSDVELAYLSDIGCERERNEDNYGYFEPEAEDDFRAKGRLLAIADGMGGHAGGQVASGLAIDILRDTFLNAKTADSETILVAAFTRAQQEILEESEIHAGLNGMGTTCTAAIVNAGKLTFGHIGDTRLYLLRRGVLAQLTEDHSLVNKLLKAGDLTPEEAASSTQRNVLTAALGMKSAQVAADFSAGPIDLMPGDTIILASDGLHGIVTADEIAQLVSDQPAYDACQVLVNLAKSRGGPDNITLQVLKILAPHFATVSHPPML